MNSLKLIAMLVRGAHPTNCIFQTGSYSSSCALSSFRLGCVRESLFSNSEISLTLLARLCTFEQYSRRCQSNVPEKGGEILTIWSLWLTCEKVGSGVQHHRGGARAPPTGLILYSFPHNPIVVLLYKVEFMLIINLNVTHNPVESDNGLNNVRLGLIVN